MDIISYMASMTPAQRAYETLKGVSLDCVWFTEEEEKVVREALVALYTKQDEDGTNPYRKEGSITPLLK